jgi:predicted DNA-binding transcriptional regulator AlpA
MIGVSSATLDRWEAAGHFPKRRVLGVEKPVRYKDGHTKAYNCRVAYLDSEVEEWMRSRT